METWHDNLLMWSCAWSVFWLWCWHKWWKCSTSNTRTMHPSTHVPSTGQGLRVTSLPTMVTLRMLREAAKENTSTVIDGETWLWLRRVEAAGLQLVEARLVWSQLITSNLIGEGTYGEVFQIHLADINYPICLKLAKGLRRREYNLRECEMLANFVNVKGVPRVLGVSLHPDAFIMTMHGQSTLASCLRLRGRAPSEAVMLRVLRDLCSVLVHIHHRRLCHNDIKVNNVMVEVGGGGSMLIVTLIDYGLMSPYGRYPFRGVRKGKIKPFYDPELMRQERPCSEATDMYSMGYLIRSMLLCLPTTRKNLLRVCARAQGPASQRPTFSELEDVFKKMLK